MNQELYDDEIGEAPIIVHQAKRYIENVGLDVSLLDVCKSGSVSVMTKSHKIEGNRQLEIVSIDWRSYDIRQDDGQEVLFVPLNHARRTAVSKYTKDGRTKDNNYNTYSTLIIRYDSNNRMSVLVGTYLYGRDMKEREVMHMGIDFESSGFSGYFITSYLDGTMLYGQYFEKGERKFGFRPNPLSPELRDSLPSENAHDHRHHLYLNLQFAKLTKSSNGSAIESFDYICSFCHKSWDQCTCIEIIEDPIVICPRCYSHVANGKCMCEFCFGCGFYIEDCRCFQDTGSSGSGGTTNNGGINGNSNNGTSGTGSTSIGGHSGRNHSNDIIIGSGMGNSSNVLFGGTQLPSYNSTHVLRDPGILLQKNIKVFESIDRVDQRKNDGNDARCNISVCMFFQEIFDGYIPEYMITQSERVTYFYHPIYGYFEYKNANRLVEQWREHDEDWFNINNTWYSNHPDDFQGLLNLVQELADNGYIVVAGWKNPTGGMGHVVVIVPTGGSAMPESKGWYDYIKGNKVKYYVPYSIDAGPQRRKYHTNLDMGFGNGKKRDIEFFYFK
ncbi:MAG: hypothetical protein MJY74_05755 [Bacteroidaceae bacterium]|nr:hypothetical protein [Bacteroidaceae bacterium]